MSSQRERALSEREGSQRERVLTAAAPARVGSE